MMNSLNEVLQHYDLGIAYGWERIEHGYVNETWQVLTSTGSYAVRRRHPDLCDPSLVTAQHALIRHLHRAGFPAPEIVSTRRGESYLVLDDGVYEVLALITGAFGDDRDSTFRAAAARVLAHYHISVQEFDEPALHRLPVRYHPATLTEIVDRLLTDRPDDVPEGDDPLLMRLDQHAHEIAAGLRAFTALPALVVHGDYYTQNIIVRDNRIAGVVDYDEAHWAPRAIEVAEALIYFAREELRDDHDRSRFRHIVYTGCLDLGLARQFLSAYCEILPLAPAEIEAFPYLVRLIWMSAALDPPLRPRLRRGQDAAALREVVQLADFGRDHADAIREVAHSASTLI
jgi:homoserine kinase type II